MEYKKLPWRESDQRIFVANITKIKNKVKWEPLVDKIQGIRITIHWINELLSKQ